MENSNFFRRQVGEALGYSKSVLKVKILSVKGGGEGILSGGNNMIKEGQEMELKYKEGEILKGFTLQIKNSNFILKTVRDRQGVVRKWGGW